ncbi:MAG: hypothetical protein NUV49_02635 [Patescibacteria group bacterium]|nr:hypothetical protein [Patescibacteria group bacterium]
MKKMQSRRQGGFVKLLVLFVILIIIISYFGIDLRAIVESPETQGNLGYVWSLAVTLWDNYLARPVLYFWNNIFIDLLWESFVNNMERIKNGGSFDFIPNTPSVGTTTKP